jgi:soluble lytic murein transglycosylase
LFQTSCRGDEVLGFPLLEAAELFKKGDVSFITNSQLPDNFAQAESRLRQLTLIHSAAPFYAGLLFSENPNGNAELGILLFCTALNSPSLPARREAALKLIPLVLETNNKKEANAILNYLGSVNSKRKNGALNTLRGACLYGLGRYNEALELNLAEAGKAVSAAEAHGIITEWNRAISLFSAWKTSGSKSEIKKEISAFLFESAPNEIWRWAYEEALSLGGKEDSLEALPSSGPLSLEEITVLQARTVLGNYLSMLFSLRTALADGGIIFFRYPNLIGDLGRAYQYTPGLRDEGYELFKNWIMLLDSSPAGQDSETGNNLQAYLKTLDIKALKTIKYLLYFYTGRIERAREKYSSSTDYFKEALTIAPDTVQHDACIWYILMNSITANPGGAGQLLLETMPLWDDASYFADVLDRLSCYYAGRRDWKSLQEIFSNLESIDAGASLAQYAWILGRAVQEGYVNLDRSAGSFFRIAFEDKKASFYYRAMAASKLGATFTPNDDSGNSHELHPDEELDFILGFFECGASSFVLPFIRNYEKELPIEALRKISRELAALNRFKDSLDLVSRYSLRKDYELNKADLFLFYPQPFKELIEKYALKAEIAPEILYGLIHTESFFESSIVSRSGAVGLSQLMPATALEMAGRIARGGGPDYREAGLVDLKNAEINVHIGSYYLRYLMEQMTSPMTALLAYNGGMGRVRRWLAADRQKGALPPDLFLETVEYTETREYGRRLLAAAAVYGYLYYGMSMEEAALSIYP